MCACVLRACAFMIATKSISTDAKECYREEVTAKAPYLVTTMPPLLSSIALLPHILSPASHKANKIPQLRDTAGRGRCVSASMCAGVSE